MNINEMSENQLEQVVGGTNLSGIRGIKVGVSYHKKNVLFQGIFARVLSLDGNIVGFEEGHSRKIPHMAKGVRRTGHVTVEQFSAKWDINDGRTDLLWD